jgi:hypothetical protein
MSTVVSILSAARVPGEAGDERKSKDPENASFAMLMQGVFSKTAVRLNRNGQRGSGEKEFCPNSTAKLRVAL